MSDLNRGPANIKDGRQHYVPDILAVRSV